MLTATIISGLILFLFQLVILLRKKEILSPSISVNLYQCKSAYEILVQSSNLFFVDHSSSYVKSLGFIHIAGNLVRNTGYEILATTY